MPVAAFNAVSGFNSKYISTCLHTELHRAMPSLY